MTRPLIRTYWVLDKETEATIARCHDKEVAEWIVANYPTECIIRWEEH